MSDNNLRQAALDYHEFPKPGKLEIRATKPLANGRDLARAYSPGVAEACLEIRALEERAKSATQQLEVLASTIPAVSRLLSVPGIGLLTATALVAFVADIQRFPSARHFASYLGLCPRESSSGSVRRLGRISKRGDTYLRMLLIHGARSCLLAAKRRTTKRPLDTWALDLESRRGHNRTAVALANKMARIVWALTVRETIYRDPAAA